MIDANLLNVLDCKVIYCLALEGETFGHNMNTEFQCRNGNESGSAAVGELLQRPRRQMSVRLISFRNACIIYNAATAEIHAERLTGYSAVPDLHLCTEFPKRKSNTRR